MKTFLSLCKVQFLAFAGINGKSSGRNKKSRSFLGKLLLLLLLGAVIVYAGYTYSQMFSDLLFEDVSELVPIMIGLSGIVSFMFSFYSTGSVLFSSKDYELLSSLPIKTRYIVLSKLIFMFVFDLAFTLLITASSIYVYNGIEPLSVKTVITYIVTAVFSCFLPLCFSIIIGTLFSYISSFFKRKKIAQTILFLAFIVVVYVVGYILTDSNNKDFLFVLKKICFLTELRIDSINNGFKLLLFVGIELLSFAIVAFITVKLFNKLNTLLTAKKTSRKFKLKKYNKQGSFKSLFKKEIFRLISSPSYFINCVLGSIFVLIISVAVCIVLFSILGKTERVEIGSVILSYLPVLFALMLIISPTTVCSISIEGNCFWLLRTSPVSMKETFRVKLFVNLLFETVPVILSSLICAICLADDFILGLLVVLSSVFISLFAGNIGLFFNILFPKMKWENEQQVIKQSMTTFLTTFLALGIAVLLGVGANKLNISALSFYILVDSVFLVLSVLLYAFIFTKGESVLLKKIDNK